MWQRFSETSRRAILNAQQEAAQTYSSEVDTGHLLMALVGDAQSDAAQVLLFLGITPEKVRAEVKSSSEGETPTPELSSIERENLAAQFQVNPALVRQLEKALLLKLRGQSEQPQMRLSKQAKRVLELASEEARETQRLVEHESFIGTAHLLLGLLRDKEGAAVGALHRLGLELESTRATVAEHLKSNAES